MEASSNVFVENLHGTRRLETTYYVTDVRQQTDFFWYRESGVRVNIGLQNVDVVPLYEDVEHLADNSFVTGSPHSADDKDWFDRVTRRHCRSVQLTAASAYRPLSARRRAMRRKLVTALIFDFVCCTFVYGRFLCANE